MASCFTPQILGVNNTIISFAKIMKWHKETYEDVRKMDYGVLTLLPIVVVVVLALITKRTLEPLIVGSLIAFVITSGWAFPKAHSLLQN